MPRSFADDTSLASGDLAFPATGQRDRWRPGIAVPVIVAISLAAWTGLFHLAGMLRLAID